MAKVDVQSVYTSISSIKPAGVRSAHEQHECMLTKVCVLDSDQV